MCEDVCPSCCVSSSLVLDVDGLSRQQPFVHIVNKSTGNRKKNIYSFSCGRCRHGCSPEAQRESERERERQRERQTDRQRQFCTTQLC